MGAGHAALDALHPQSHQGVCGDAIAAIEGIDREAVDALALVRQQGADRAIKEGRFDKSLPPLLNPDRSVALDHEEFPRPETNAVGHAELEPSLEAIADRSTSSTMWKACDRTCRSRWHPTKQKKK